MMLRPHPIAFQSLWVILVTGGTAILTASALADDAKFKPNVLLFLTDDQRADCVGVLGNPAIRTPVMDELNLTKNTIVIFASDNGLAIGSHGLMGKQSLYEHSAKVPLIIAGPGFPKGSTDALVYLMDLFPTVCDLVGIPVPEKLDGKSLKSVIEGDSKGVRDRLFYSYRDVQRAIRNDRWKLICYPMISKTQLFDLQTDPSEMKDLAGDPAQGGRIKQMLVGLAELQSLYGDQEKPTTRTKP